MALRLFAKAAKQLRLELATLATCGRSLYKAPPTWGFLTVWMAALVYLATAGYWNYVWLALAGLGVIAIWSGITLRITDSPPPEGECTVRPVGLAAAQLVIIGAILVITGHSSLAAHGALSPDGGTIPLWSAFLDRLRDLAVALRAPSPGYIVNPVLYFLIPFCLLIALGVPPRELGFCPSHRWLRITVLWSAFGIGAAAYALITGSLGISGLLEALLQNTMQNGFFEEFLFRGALLTTCRNLFGRGWALAISSVVFGIWHTGAGFSMSGGDSLVTGLCVAVALHSLGGLTFGLIFIRTRSLLAPSIVHVLLNLV